MLEGWKQGLRNCWWIIDYNRQSLDAVVREGLWERYEQLFKNFGWDVVILKYGSLQQAAFREPGGETLRQWIDRCPNQLYSALVFQGGAAWRKRLLDEIGDQGPATKLIESRSDEELARLMNNLGGHDLPSIVEAFDRINHDRPVCFIAYTVKGVGLPIAGHKDNHAGLMTPTQMEAFRQTMNIRAGHEWEPFEGLRAEPGQIEAFLKRVPFAQGGPRRLKAPAIPVPDELKVSIQPEMSTHFGFGAILNELAPISGRGSIAAGCSRAKAWPTRSRASASPRPSTGSSRRRASTSSSALPRTTCSSRSRRWACRTRLTASGCFRSARSTIRSSPAASMR
jgi:pyruvate dehydrogenase E1 component